MSIPAALAFDTSNYTTSCAVFDGTKGRNSGRLLDVRPGELGLRQSEALFSHVKRLPEIYSGLALNEPIIAVGASSKPRETEDSYMPCFLAGSTMGSVLAETLKVPFFTFSHQQGHIAAAAWSAGRPELLDQPHLAWHLSGGTTELLHVVKSGSAVHCTIIGGTQDVSAGQLIDRTGQLLKLAFPAGKAIDALSAQSIREECYSMKLNGLHFSLSGVEHKMKQKLEAGDNAEDVARFVLLSLISGVARITAKAREQYGNLPVLFSGGVASNSLLRERMPDGIFAQPAYSTDNALGAAILTYRAVTAHG
ncbi:MAG: DNA-binding protein [Oscillospiraceae bacterium]|nr:DNA-binding protein [Oscillospiraceae bacterium]